MSALSISSISSTDGLLGDVIARSSGRGRMKRSEKKTSSCAAMRSTASLQRRGAGDHLADLVLEDLGVEELLGVLPLVERLGLVEPLVALEADQLVVERAGEHLGELGLADAGRPFDQDRLLEAARQVDDGRDRAVAM